ncbi:MAG: hypothetical protein IPO00_03610 [Betaproteobacteria bacterium]|nr:hypothetical protein [Betaproteobacteria bacterium]
MPDQNHAQQFGQLAPEAWGKHANEICRCPQTGDEEGMRCWGRTVPAALAAMRCSVGLPSGVGGAVGRTSSVSDCMYKLPGRSGIAAGSSQRCHQLAAIGAGSAVGGTAGATGVQ